MYRGVMMSRKRSTFTTEFKTHVVLEALQGELTISQLATKYAITSKNILNWKQLFLDNAALAFEATDSTKSSKAELAKLKKENEKLNAQLTNVASQRDAAITKLQGLDVAVKKKLIDTHYSKLSIARQCEIINLNRTSLYYAPKPTDDKDAKIIHRIQEIHTSISSAYGYRMMHQQLIKEGYRIGVNKVHKLMKMMELHAKQKQDDQNKIHPYLLHDLSLAKPTKL